MFKNLFNRQKSEDDQAAQTDQVPLNSELGTDKLKAMIAEVSQAFPLFEKAGFHIEQVEVEIGATPKLVPKFVTIKQIPPEEQQALIDEAVDHKLVQFMLISLFKAYGMHKLINDPKLEFHAIEITLTSIPSVRAIFKSIEDANKVVRLTTSDMH